MGEFLVTYSRDVAASSITQTSIKNRENYRVCPNVTVSCDPRDRRAKEAIHYPSLVVEVLSPTTEARDRGKKSLHYRFSPTIQNIAV